MIFFEEIWFVNKNQFLEKTFTDLKHLSNNNKKLVFYNNFLLFN